MVLVMKYGVWEKSSVPISRMNSWTALLTASGAKSNSAATRLACSARAMLRCGAVLKVLRVEEEEGLGEERGESAGGLGQTEGGEGAEGAGGYE